MLFYFSEPKRPANVHTPFFQKGYIPNTKVGMNKGYVLPPLDWGFGFVSFPVGFNGIFH